MQMNNDYIYKDYVNHVDDMIDDDHVLRLMSKYVDNQYKKKRHSLMMDEIEIDVQ